ncbi:MAG: hypothetical protein AB1730_14075 [Myxococcota bacterium]
MKRSVLRVASIGFVAGVLAVSASCGVPLYDLSVSLDPSIINNAGQSCTVSVLASDDTGQVGKGTVTLQAAAGTLADTTLTLDSFGAARTTFSCNVAVDDRCQPGASVRISAEWNIDGQVVQGERRVRLAPVDAGTTSTDAGVPNGVFVMGFLGTYGVGMAPVDRPTEVQVGFESIGADFINRSGNVVGSGFEHRADSFAMSGSGSAYPTDYRANDTRIDSPGCTGTEYVTGLLEYGVGRYAYRCGTLPNTGNWYLGSTPLTLPTDTRLIGYDETALVAPTPQTAQLIFADGTTQSVTLPTSNVWFPVRALPDGSFWILQASSLLQIRPSGVAVELATYAMNPNTFIDDQRRYYYIAREAGRDRIYRVYPGMNPRIDTVYDSAQATPQDFSVYPPKVYVEFDLVAGARLLTRR